MRARGEVPGFLHNCQGLSPPTGCEEPPYWRGPTNMDNESHEQRQVQITVYDDDSRELSISTPYRAAYRSANISAVDLDHKTTLP